MFGRVLAPYGERTQCCMGRYSREHSAEHIGVAEFVEGI